jgi:ABC-2 type transport system permease protein
MSSPPNAVPESSVDSQGVMLAAMSATRPLYWSVRRELWENRSIYIAPLVVAGVTLFGFLVSAMTLARRMPAVLTLNPAEQSATVARPYEIAAFLMIVTGFLVGVIYCLDALHGERRDRSILFWKSLPVSDRTTVLSKASIPLVVLPLFIFAVIVTTQMIMLVLNAAVLLGSGASLAALWANLPLFRIWLTLAYLIAAIALWHAPIYAWLLLVSGWARRAAFLWAVLPPLALAVFERIAFGTSYVGALLQYRLCGGLAQACPLQGTVPLNPLTLVTPGKFLSAPCLWIGLALTVVFLAAAARLRRYRSPI